MKGWRQRLSSVVALAWLVAAVTGTAAAQGTTSRVVGTVTDVT